jgi:hypothetical protein
MRIKRREINRKSKERERRVMDSKEKKVRKIKSNQKIHREMRKGKKWIMKICDVHQAVKYYQILIFSFFFILDLCNSL